MPTPTPRIAILGIRAPSLNSPDLEHFADIASLLAAPAFDVVLLDLPAAYAGRVLRKLRTIPPYRYNLIYCCRDQNGWCEALGDGACPVDSSEIRTLWGVWQERYRLFKRGSAPERFESRVLSWLWLRDNAHIYALRDPRGASALSLPVAGRPG